MVLDIFLRGLCNSIKDTLQAMFSCTLEKTPCIYLFFLSLNISLHLLAVGRGPGGKFIVNKVIQIQYNAFDLL